MAQSRPSNAQRIKDLKTYFKTNIPNPTSGDRGFVQMTNVTALKRMIVETELLSRQGSCTRYKILYTAEGGSSPTSIIVTVLGTNDLTADPATSPHIILRTNALPVSGPPEILDDTSPFPPVDFDTIDEVGPAQVPPEIKDGEIQIVVEPSGGTPDSTFKFKFYGDDDD